MKETARRIGNVILNVVIFIIIILAIVISVSTFTSTENNGVPDVWGYSPFSIQTNSMSPTISQGDYIIVQQCDTDELVVGDIISYFTIIENVRVINTHRIVAISETEGYCSFTTQGDNVETNQEVDELAVIAGDVIGIYTGVKVPYLGYAMTFMSTQLGFFLFILLPVLLYTVYQIYLLSMAIVYNRQVQMLEEVKAEATDEMKQTIIQEYLEKESLWQEKNEREGSEESIGKVEA